MASTRTLTAAVTILLIAMIAGCDEETSDTFAAKIGDRWFTLETALTPQEQAQGLMGRTEIAADGGMIFIFDDDQERQFWMKNCLVDMDIIYVDRTGRIVSTYTMKALPLRQPDETEMEYERRVQAQGSYPSRGRARYVIELKAGTVDELGLKRGDKLDLDLDRLKELAASADGR